MEELGRARKTWQEARRIAARRTECGLCMSNIPIAVEGIKSSQLSQSRVLSEFLHFGCSKSPILHVCLFPKVQIDGWNFHQLPSIFTAKAKFLDINKQLVGKKYFFGTREYRL